MSKKITFLVLALIVAFSFSLMAEPVIKPLLPNTYNNTVNARNGRALVPLVDGVNYRSINPKAMPHILAAPGGEYMLYMGRGTSTGSYYGIYAYYSTDYGATWTQTPSTSPVITPESTYTRIYTALALGSSSLAYAPYTIANIRVGSAAANDTIMFAADLSGLGAGDWQTAVAADNSDGAYRYLPNITVVNDADIFVPVMDLYGDFYLHHSSDYGTTWSQIYHFDANYFTPLLANAGQFDSITGPAAADIPKIIVNGSQLIFIGDVNVDAWVDTTSSTIGALFWATSDDNGVTWSDPQWVDSDVLPINYSVEGVNWAGWDANITSNGKIFISAVYPPDDTTKTCKFFAHVYDGSNWTTTQIAPDDNATTGAWTGLASGYAISQQASAVVDNAGNGYVYWEDIYKVVGDTAAYWGIAMAKYNGTAWSPACFVDTTIGFYNYVTVASNADDNGNVLIGLVPGDAPNDTLYLIPEPTTGIATKNVNTVKTMNLAQNMPNPVRGNTTINYSVTKSGHVTLNVYDMSGKLVKTLVNGNVNAGTHSVVWNRTDNRNNKVAGGVYFYKMNANNETLTKKMIVVK